MSDLDQLIKQVSDIEAAVKGGGVIDKDALVSEMKSAMTAYVDEQVKEKLAAQPVRRAGISQRAGVGLVADDGTVVKPTSKYYRHLKAFATDGVYQDWNIKVRGVDLYLAHLLVSKAHTMQPDRYAAPSEDLNAAVKALGSTVSGAGDEYVPTGMATELWQDFFVASRIANTVMPVAMPSNPFDVPRGLGAPTWRKASENLPVSTPDVATGKDTLTATELAATQAWSYTMDEDAVVALMPSVRAELQRSGGDIIDDFCLNADSTATSTGNINLDDSTPPSDSYYLSDGQDGLRHAHIVDNTAMTANMAAALTDAGLTGMLALMDKYATDVRNLVLTCDIGTYLNGFLSTASGAPGSFVTTLEKFGANAILLTGQIASYRGIPIVPSPVYRKSEADGKLSVTSGNNTKGGITAYHRGMWKLGFRRDLLVEVDRDITSRQFIMVISLRPAIGCRGPRSSQFHTAGMRNITI